MQKHADTFVLPTGDILFCGHTAIVPSPEQNEFAGHTLHVTLFWFAR